MSFRVTQVDLSSFPNEAATHEAAQAFGITLQQLRDMVLSFGSATARTDNVGHQQILAAELEQHMKQSLSMLGLQSMPRSVSPVLGERVDFSAGKTPDPPYILGEIEFRPNFEKDIVKFAIAARRGLLGLGVLVVAKSRSEINARYTSMPEYRKVLRTVAEYDPPFPILVIGLSGQLQ